MRGQWLRPGLSIFGIGRPNEFDDDVYLRADLITVTSKTHELDYYDTQLDQPLIRLAQNGAISWNSVAELGDILAEQIHRAASGQSIIVFRDSQGGYGDLPWRHGRTKKRAGADWGRRSVPSSES